MTATVKREKITPSKARKWLADQNEGNRRARRSVVSQYARDITAGQWSFTGDPIRFNGDSKLVDGQHRLMAVIEANTPIDAIVIRGLDASSKFVIDTGAKRTLGDVLHYQGYTHTAALAAVIRWCVGYERGELDGSHARQTVSVPEATRWLDENPNIVDAVKDISNRSFPYMSTRSALMAIRYYTRNTFPGDAKAFVESLHTAENLSSDDPVYVLRRWLEWAYVREGRLRSSLHAQAITVKAWNAYISGEKPKSLSYRPGGKSPEQFPAIITNV